MADKEVSQATEKANENSPPIQLVSQGRQASKNSTQSFIPVLDLSQPEEKQQSEQVIDIIEPEVPQGLKVVSPLDSAPAKLLSERSEHSEDQESSQGLAKPLTKDVVQQPESSSAQIEQNEISVPFISARLKQKFLEYQRQRQQQQRQLGLKKNSQSEGQTESFSSPMRKSDRAQNGKKPEYIRVTHNTPSVNQECVESRGVEMANQNSIQHEIAALREILENYREMSNKESFLRLSNDTWNADTLNIASTQGDEGKWTALLTNHTSTPNHDEKVRIPYEQKDTQVFAEKKEQKDNSSVTVLQSAALSRQEHSSFVEEEGSAPSSVLLPDSFTNNIPSPPYHGKFSFRSFFDVHSNHIQRLEHCLQAAYKGDVQQFLVFISETPSRNYVDLLFYCLERLLCDADSNPNRNADRIHNLEMRILEEQKKAGQNLDEIQTRQATISDEIEDYQAKLSRTELALKVAVTEKRHLEHRHPSIKLCGSMEDEIGKLESRQRQRERQLQRRMSQKEKHIEQLQQILARRDKKIGLVYSEITELLKNIEEVQDNLQVVH
ncbi:uncharacterized protein Gasu_59970 [Galdieria sulphuraria]|uniref:Uncharacterized protein n=1 Tax=Galdieria sulphuraria TaxID=130081 RepID=M2XSK1_GALSU|nr:uncharacterized protein Gasu_59970 [Galdieria sulphuraria]EME26379.1 hypothetical protein Gasu_59970 [Galdieria sulphuraria]|eukprot:XP_005702899.1 hypothetical protein Gasu_59970 [Galdieria sulphuraria]